jgi:DNA-binding LytR/AlgR family response regulator
MKYDVVVIDDEYLAISIIRNYLKEHDAYSLKASFTNATEGLDFLQEGKIDVLFLDIQMPLLNGFQLLRKLKNPPLIIFTTANPNFALDAFDVHAVDYLLKPFSKDRFAKAMGKISHLLSNNNSNRSVQKSITVKSGFQHVQVPVNDIVYIESMNEYIKIYTNEKNILSLGALRDMQDQLPTDTFIRIHRSYIVHIQSINSFNANEVSLRTGQVLPVGRVHRKAFLEQMSGK